MVVKATTVRTLALAAPPCMRLRTPAIVASARLFHAATAARLPANTFPQKDIAIESTRVHRPVEDLIKNDHRSFYELHERYSSTPEAGEKGIATKQAIVNEFIREVAQHSIAEETTVYNLVDDLISEKVGDHLRHDHFEVKESLYKLHQMKVGDKGFDELFGKIVGLLKTHAKEEETSQLPALARKIPNVEERTNISAKFLRAKVIAPTRPHPSAPDKPAILELLAGLPLAPIDKLQDQTKTFAERRIPQE